MTTLSLAARNLLAQDADLRAMLARSESWDTWIFDENPVGSKIEQTSKCLIVITEGDPWTSANEHNTLWFPTINVDVWADPSRNANKSVKIFDAKTKIERIIRQVDKSMHRVQPSGPDGMPVLWGTAAEISSKTGQLIVDSKRSSGGIIYSPIRDTEGAWMGRATYNISRP